MITFITFKILIRIIYSLSKNDNARKLFFQGLGHIALVVSPSSSRSSSPVSSMFFPYTAELEDKCAQYILQWFYPRDLEWAWEVYRSMEPSQRETFLDQSVSSGLREIQRWVPCSIDVFFNLSSDAQLPILNFLRAWAATTDNKVFQQLSYNLWNKREELDRTNAICALGANNLRLNYYPYNPNYDAHAERVAPYIVHDILEEHHSLDAFIEHSWYQGQVMNEILQRVPKIAAETFL